ncbi:SCO4402 family protein [Caulobacter sp. SL161]|uniref:SCO4402 family protein n=1 Tax=Caulobacter sp. SL161 TaxID=2995156 RepID=UPI003FA38A50
MERDFPPDWADLLNPWIRVELIAYLEELAIPDPRPIWRAQAKQGLISGVDQVIHFFFDDHDFDDSDVGSCLFDQAEVALVQSVKRALDRLVEKLPYGGDEEYVTNPLWKSVTASASAAHEAIRGRIAKGG